VTSSAPFKDDIKLMDNASESILALRPVTFRYKKQIDVNRTPQVGLVAADVAKVNRDLVINGQDGKPYTMRYEAVNAMLLNEFLKAHRKIEEQEAIIAQQRKDFKATIAKIEETVNARLDEQAAQIQSVRAQVQMNSPAARVVASKQ
jgi:hypothetical protein